MNEVIEKENQTVTELFGETIYSYTRAQAIEDGELVDVSETAREAGFRWPVAITSATWADCIAWSKDDNHRHVYQDLSGRLWDVLWMAFNAIRNNPDGGTQIEYHAMAKASKRA